MGKLWNINNNLEFYWEKCRKWKAEYLLAAVIAKVKTGKFKCDSKRKITLHSQITNE